jgi:hypothetical protein
VDKTKQKRAKKNNETKTKKMKMEITMKMEFNQNRDEQKLGNQSEIFMTLCMRGAFLSLPKTILLF